MVKEKNNVYIDIAKFIAALSVVLLHMTNQQYSIIVHLNALTRWAVPFFFMISGYYSFDLGEYERNIVCGRLLKLLKLAVIMELFSIIHRASTSSIKDIVAAFTMPGNPVNIRLFRISGGDRWIWRRLVHICAYYSVFDFCYYS